MKYPSKTLIKNISPTPRTLSEANKDAKYACAIQTFKSDTKLTLDFIGNAVVGGLWVLVVSAAVFSLFVFITGWRF